MIAIKLPGLKAFNGLQCRSKLFIESLHSVDQLRCVNGLTVLGALEDALKSISSTFQEQLLCQYSCTKKILYQTIIRENLKYLCKILSCKKVEPSMLMKLTPGRRCLCSEPLPAQVRSSRRKACNGSSQLGSVRVILKKEYNL